MNRYFWLFCAAFVLGGLSAAARAETVTVLSRDVAQVGQPVMLNYRFVNTGMPEDMPRPAIAVDGLDIRYNGMQTQSSSSFNFGGGGMQSNSETAFEFMYVVTPDRPGNFTIPGFEVRAGGRRIRTKPVNLRVVGSGSYAPQVPVVPNRQQMMPPSSGGVPMTPPSGGTSQDSSDARAYHGEMVIGSKSAYVGEVIPVELRFYFRADFQFDNLQRPSFGGEGFTAAPLSEPEQTEQVIEGIPYNVVTFRSAITPVKSGQIEIPAAAMEGRMITQDASTGLDPFFDQFFRNFPGVAPGTGRAENIRARTNRRKLEILALPKDGKPENFSGAVGQFTMEAQADPKTAAAGEPVTLQLTVSGRGNFDAIAAPELTGDDGWRTYAPKSSFTPEDSRGFGKSSGTKTFEFSMVARKDREETPGALFSYFDPREKKYVTLTADPVAVQAAGAGAAAGAEPDRDKSVVPAAAAVREPEPKPAAKAEAADVAAPAESLAENAPGFEAWVQRPWFLALNLLLLFAALIAIPYLLWMRRRAKKSALVSELETTLRRAKVGWQNTGERDVFYAAAAHYVLAQLALWDNRPVAGLNVPEALGRRVPDPLERRGIESVLARHDELKYGGGGGGALDTKERGRVVAALEKFSASHA